jgi:hypothetical protein
METVINAGDFEGYCKNEQIALEKLTSFVAGTRESKT